MKNEEGESGRKEWKEYDGEAKKEGHKVRKG